jgi:2-furoate---CoA ligase
VTGVSDDRWGQRVVAFVVADSVDEEELDRHCRDSPNLAGFKRPREYRFVDELPKSPAGKLLRRK